MVFRLPSSSETIPSATVSASTWLGGRPVLSATLRRRGEGKPAVVPFPLASGKGLSCIFFFSKSSMEGVREEEEEREREDAASRLFVECAVWPIPRSISIADDKDGTAFSDFPTRSEVSLDHRRSISSTTEFFFFLFFSLTSALSWCWWASSFLVGALSTGLFSTNASGKAEEEHDGKEEKSETAAVVLSDGVALDLVGVTDVFFPSQSSAFAAWDTLEEAFRSKRGNGKEGAEAEALRELAWVRRGVSLVRSCNEGCSRDGSSSWPANAAVV